MSEEKNPENKLNRRELLGTGLAGALMLAGYSCLGLKDAMAAAKKSGRPLFSPEALNALFPTQPNAEYRALLTEALNNPQAFVRNHFTLTPDQEKSLNGMSPSDLSALKLGLDTALRENLRLVADCRTRGGRRREGERVVAEGSSLNFTKMMVDQHLPAVQPQSRATQPAQRNAPQQRPATAVAQTAALNDFAGTLNLTMSGLVR